MDALSLLDRAAQLGVRVVQFADNLPLDALSPAELDALEQRALAGGFQIEVGARGLALDHLRCYLRLAERFRSPILRVVVDTAAQRPSEEAVIETARALAPELERAGVCLALENHDRFPVRTLARIMERVNSSRLGICLDTVNSFGALEGPDVVVAALGPWTVNLHVKDFAIARASHKLGFTVEGRPAGQGQLNVPWLLERLRAFGRDPNAILELWTPPERTWAETVAKEAAWAAASVEYLRALIPN
jgi:sugar phosphate isomerase/epimerase